ncbi:hypothetical protein L2E82_00343 [Cichorium intybus]|uniref:Uncharacterized protein n=1 Tax=Cichorium intybus TaxID=13427 RepID=A0ACB9GWL5_CICIN|nr:hypothetical protein L2E82_00343 [Cichorium intybus]
MAPARAQVKPASISRPFVDQSQIDAKRYARAKKIHTKEKSCYESCDSLVVDIICNINKPGLERKLGFFGNN